MQHLPGMHRAGHDCLPCAQWQISITGIPAVVVSKKFCTSKNKTNKTVKEQSW
eukprot:TRINITY_DN3978_c0_g1_i1.p3 TRINITY_DN3978_c0_g1~~TRINITY_DN3978_c0_g1_i1.p3  ORF type:complete len:53 (+),score=11.73 TRINITY_DN3978_c0_g1_i1:87-245(+)